MGGLKGSPVPRLIIMLKKALVCSIVKKKLAPSTMNLTTRIKIVFNKYRVNKPTLIAQIENDIFETSKEIPVIDTSSITEEQRVQIRKSFTGAAGSCGCTSFNGNYKIFSEAYAAAIIEEFSKDQSRWNRLLILGTSPVQTEQVGKFLEAAGFELVKEFGQAHNNGKMSLWTVYRDGGLYEIEPGANEAAE